MSGSTSRTPATGRKRFTRVAVSVVAGGAAVTGLGLGAASLASAQDTTPTPSPQTPTAQTSAPADGARGPHGDKGPGGRAGIDAEALATKLGVDQAKVTEALKAIGQERRDAAPSDGAAKPDPSTRPDEAARTAELAKSLAEKLGVDQAKVQSALDELRTEHRAAEESQLKTTLDRAVTDGKLSRAEADAVLKAQQAGVIDAHGPR